MATTTTTTNPKKEPLVNKNTQLQSYYASLESRIGYQLFLGGTRHFGYYEVGTWWPFPIGRALRRMEDHLCGSLSLPAGATVLDAGCGYGHVAIHLARSYGLNVQGIDVVDRHVARAQRNVEVAGLDKATTSGNGNGHGHGHGQVTIQKGDYHHLDEFPDSSLDGVYTMETFVHATDPRAVLSGFFRILKPGGSIALYEYDHHTAGTNAPPEMLKMFDQVNRYAAMPANVDFERGTLPALLSEVGFQDVKLVDLSYNIKPMLRLFFVFAYIPYLIIRFFGLEAYFINTVAAIVGYRYQSLHRYVAISARKPSSDGESRVLESKKAV